MTCTHEKQIKIWGGYHGLMQCVKCKDILGSAEDDMPYHNEVDKYGFPFENLYTVVMPNAVIGLLRGVGFVALTAILTYLGDITHLSMLTPTTATIISTLALGLEHMFSKPGTAFFGSVKRS